MYYWYDAISFVFFVILSLLVIFLHSYDKDYIKYIMAIQYLTKKNLPRVEYKDNLHVFSSHSTFNIIHVTLYISLYFISIKKYYMLFICIAWFSLKLKNLV
jgi:hypothetical protein